MQWNNGASKIQWATNDGITKCFCWIFENGARTHLKEKEDGPLFKFYEVIMDVGGEFMQTVNSMKDITLFAPSNEAWSDPMVQNIIR